MIQIPAIVVKIPVAWWIIIGLSLWIVQIKSCQKACPAAMTTVKVDTVIDHQVQHVPVYIPTEGAVIRDTDYLAMWVDTAGIIKDYLSKRSYNDTVRNKYGYVLVIDTIYQNKIASRDVTFHMDVPQITLTSTIQPKNKVFLGLNLGGSKDFVSFGGGLFLLTKTDKLYYAGASYTSLGGVYYNAGAAFKIHF